MLLCPIFTASCDQGLCFGVCAAAVSLVSDQPELPAAYKARLAGIPGLSHVTVEVQPCPGAH